MLRKNDIYEMYVEDIGTEGEEDFTAVYMIDKDKIRSYPEKNDCHVLL